MQENWLISEIGSRLQREIPAFFELLEFSFNTV